MTQWFRRSNAGGDAREETAPLPPTPGGSGGSGFGGVGEGPGDETRAARRTRTGTPSPTTNGRGRAGRTAATPEERRFAQVYAEDRVGPMPYPNQASPDVGAARSRVRALVDQLLPNGVDEGTGDALDPLVASWASGWLSRIDSEHADHHAVIDRLIGGARRQLTEAEANHERDRRALDIARQDYDDARTRLIEPVADEQEESRRGRRRSWRERLRLPGRRRRTSPEQADPPRRADPPRQDGGPQHGAAQQHGGAQPRQYGASPGAWPPGVGGDPGPYGPATSSPAGAGPSSSPSGHPTAAEPDPYRVAPADPPTGPLPALGSPTGAPGDDPTVSSERDGREQAR